MIVRFNPTLEAGKYTLIHPHDLRDRIFGSPEDEFKALLRVQVEVGEKVVATFEWVDTGEVLTKETYVLVVNGTRYVVTTTAPRMYVAPRFVVVVDGKIWPIPPTN